MLVAQPATVCAAEFSGTVSFGPLRNDGAWLTALTVIVNVWGTERSTPPLAVPPLSSTSTVKVEVPAVSGAGV